MSEQSNFYNYFSSLYGSEIADHYLEFISKEPSTYIRVNNVKIETKNLAEYLQHKYGIVTEQIECFPNVLKVVSGSERIGKTLEHVLGLYYIQGLSSMLPPLVLNPTSDNMVLDLCGAPGSKSTQLAELMENRGTLIVNEVDLDRIKSLVFNIDRMNVSNAGIIQSKGELLSKVYEDLFDKILVDAPCSGLGIIQKKEEVGIWWSLDYVSRLHDLQLRLLIAAIKMARVGGEIVYSTCTLSVEENEMVIDKVLNKYPVELETINLPVKTKNGFCEFEGKKLNPQLKNAVRILPWEIDSDGFFLVKMKKTGETNPPEKNINRLNDLKLITSSHKDIKKYIEQISLHFGIDIKVFENYKFLMKGKDVYFVSADWHDDNLVLFTRIGLKFGSIDKKDRLTFHSQAAQALENHITKFIYDVKNEDELRNYLSGWKIKDTFMDSGQYVVRYNGIILGTAVETNEGLKSRFPRTKRTQNFDY